MILSDVSVKRPVFAAVLALLLIPGPTVVLILSYALSQGRKVADSLWPQIVDPPS